MKKPHDIQALDKRIKDFQKAQEKRLVQSVDKADGESALTGFQMSIELVAGVFIGAAIGFFLDFVFDTRPIFLSVLTILGGAAGVLNIYRSTTEEFKE